jgi:hypothetical protein
MGDARITIIAAEPPNHCEFHASAFSVPFISRHRVTTCGLGSDQFDIELDGDPCCRHCL